MSGIRRTPEDIRTSKMVRERDGWRCMRCNRQYPTNSQGLHAAHCFTRRTKATRHDPLNLLALCYGCHQFVDSHAAEKEALWRLRIGNVAYDALVLRAHKAGKERTVAENDRHDIEEAKAADRYAVDNLGASIGHTQHVPEQPA